MKKTVIAVTLLALLMSGCNKPTSAASASDVTSASPSTSVDSDSNHRVTKEVFLRLLTTGLANATMTLTNTETEDGETSTTTTYLSYVNDVACLSQPGYSLSYLRLKDKVLTQADAEIENGTIVTTQTTLRISGKRRKTVSGSMIS
jgi:PBP1b-binding outer membrane lipoprotein LpoB